MRVAGPLLSLSLLASCAEDAPGGQPRAGEAPDGAPSAGPSADFDAKASLLPAVGCLERHPPIVLVTVDTLRREHLGCYGYRRPTSPVIDALAADSVVFERALATMVTTVPSHLSMMTGLYAHQHGLTSNVDGVERPFVSSDTVTTLARTLNGAGYETAAFVSSIVVHGRTGLSDGFEHYAESPLSTCRT